MGRSGCQLAVIADDLTGALDTGVQFAVRGIPTCVTIEPTSTDQAPERASVLVADTETRHAQPGAAYERVVAAVGWCCVHGVARFYKKTDSTLRGNLGSELTALLATASCNDLLFVPAFPGMNRQTIDGHQYIDGVPLHKTSFGSDPLAPIPDSHIPNLIQSQTDVEVSIAHRPAEIPIKPVRQKRIIVCDASTERDLRRIGDYLRRHDKLNCTAGCAGFASVLADLLPFKRERSKIYCLSGPMLVICGSLHAVSRRQVRVAESCGMQSLCLPAGALIADAFMAAREGVGFEKNVAHLLRSGQDVIVTTVEGGDNQHRVTKKASRRVARNLSELVYRLVCESAVATLVIFGGDTSARIMERLGWRCLELVAELLPGLPLSRTGAEADPIVITKAGGFGDDTVLPRLRDMLNSARQA